MATYSVQGPPHAGAQIAMAAPGGATGDLAPTGQGIGLLVNNASGARRARRAARAAGAGGAGAGPAVPSPPGRGRGPSAPAVSVAHYRPSGWLLLAEWETGQEQRRQAEHAESRRGRRAAARDRAD